MALCLVTVSTAQNKKLIIGEWLVEKMYLNDQLLYDRSNEVDLFATYKKMAFGDTAQISVTDSLSLVETLNEAKKGLGSISLSFDAKGGHQAGNYDEQTKKQKYAKGIYKFAPGNDKDLMVKMVKSKTFDHITIVELTATTLVIKEGNEASKDGPMMMTFTRQPAKQQKPKR